MGFEIQVDIVKAVFDVGKRHKHTLRTRGFARAQFLEPQGVIGVLHWIVDVLYYAPQFLQIPSFLRRGSTVISIRRLIWRTGDPRLLNRYVFLVPLRRPRICFLGSIMGISKSRVQYIQSADVCITSPILVCWLRMVFQFFILLWLLQLFRFGLSNAEFLTSCAGYGFVNIAIGVLLYQSEVRFSSFWL